MSFWCRRFRAVAGVAISILVFPAWAGAQTPPDSTRVTNLVRPVPTAFPSGPMEELLSVYVPRDATKVQAFLDEVREMERTATDEVNDARRLAAVADGRQRVMQEEIRTTKVRRDVAKKDKDEAARTELDAAMKRQENERKYLEHLRDALQADADYLDTERDAAAKRATALELELQAAEKHAAISAGGQDPAKVSDYRAVLRRLLEAQKASAERWQDASAKRKKVAERRLKQLESLSKL
ncbi:MAG TPA: hypothetical protein VFX78_11230 [Candidatus Eisenbacteria bacterium]|nr:hypothetical protein [Candidatus Eisenbacteria bacterium]